MKTLTPSLKALPLMLLALGLFTGCESTDGGGSGGSTAVYYGVGLNDPWYYGDYHDDHNIIVTPPRPGDRPEAPPTAPPTRPERPSPPPRPEQPIARPEQPMARPTAEPRATAQPMPSIPSMPRPSFRR